LERLASFVAFLPPYLIPFLALLCLLTLQSSIGGRAAEALTPVAAIVAIAVVPAALNIAQTASIIRRTLRTDFARTLVAVGASPRYQRARLLNNVVAEIVPSLEKMLTSMTAALLFAEPVLGLSGFGTTAVRAVRRSDPDLLMGVTLLLAFAVGLFRLAALVVRRHYGLRA
jgi:ABC-type dipeptide/oligopeptide/nickel transport system permease component